MQRSSLKSDPERRNGVSLVQGYTPEAVAAAGVQGSLAASSIYIYIVSEFRNKFYMLFVYFPLLILPVVFLLSTVLVEYRPVHVPSLPPASPPLLHHCSP